MKKSSMLAIGMLILFSSSTALAVNPILRRGTNPMWASFTMGGAIAVSNTWGQFKIAEEFGYHFSGDSAGPAIAFELQQSFGSNFFVFETGPKFVWDIPIIEGIGLYLSPSMLLGLGLVEGTAGVTIQPAFRGKLILGDRGMVFFQPFGFDIWANGDAVGVRYEILFGGGVTF